MGTAEVQDQHHDGYDSHFIRNKSDLKAYERHLNQKRKEAAEIDKKKSIAAPSRRGQAYV